MPISEYKIQDSPALFIRQLGVKPSHAIAVFNAPPAFRDALATVLPPNAHLLPADDSHALFAANVVIYWPAGIVDMMTAITLRLQNGTAPLVAFWVVIPKKPVAEKRGSGLLFQPVLDTVLPTGLVDNKTLTFSDEEYGIRFVPRKPDGKSKAKA